MSRTHQQNKTAATGWDFLAFDNVSVRLGEAILFKNTAWTWRAGEQWAMLGPDGAGKALLVQAILGQAMIAQGEVRGPFPSAGLSDPVFAPVVARVSPETQRHVAVEESPFYQLRWHSGLEQGARRVADFLSQSSVEDHNRFEVGYRLKNCRQFLDRRRRFIEWLGIENLWRRNLIHLSNGEMRKVLLVHALLKCPHLLILEDPYSGLDTRTRLQLGRVVTRLMRDAWPVLFTTQRVEEIPAAATHVLLVDNHRVVGQGPRREMIGLWRERFGGSRRAPARLRSLAPKARQQGQGLRQPLVELNHVTVRGVRRKLLHDISWTLREGECWALLGPNGAGKSTLLNLIQGDHPQAYSEDIQLFGQPTNSTQALWRARGQFGWMSPELHQHYPAGWNSQEVVCSGFFNSLGLYEACSRAQRQTARQWLLDLGLGLHLLTPFDELSFGQQRLVLLARGAVKRPRLLILDEPCQGLDAEQRRTLLGAVDRVVAQTGASLIFVTHHKDEVPRCISHILRLAQGRLQTARPKSSSPRPARTASAPVEK